MGPSPIPYDTQNQTPRPMTREDMDRVKEQYVRSTQLVLEASPEAQRIRESMAKAEGGA